MNNQANTENRKNEHKTHSTGVLNGRKQANGIHHEPLKSQEDRSPNVNYAD
jgi:hypothetical protein